MADLLASGAPGELERPLRVLIEMQGDPVRIGGDRVALACAGVAAWADGEGKRATAAEFTHAAALACPGSPGYALASARRSREEGRYTEAEAMYQRAVALARQTGDWDSYTRAHAGLGKVAQRRGTAPAARRALQRALRSAERRSLRALRPFVLHDLFTVEIDCRRDEQAEEYARAAAEAYGPGHANLSALASDVAVFWIDRGRFADALVVLDLILPHINETSRVSVLGNIARAAGAAGDSARFGSVRSDILALPESAPRRLDALRGLAQGAASLGFLEQAEHTAMFVLRVAREREEHGTVFEMEALVERIGLLNRQEDCPSSTSIPALSGSLLLDTLERVLSGNA